MLIVQNSLKFKVTILKNGGFISVHIIISRLEDIQFQETRIAQGLLSLSISHELEVR